MARWQKRWWCLHGTTLSYQNHPKDSSDNKRIFDLANVCFIREGSEVETKDVDRIFELGYGERVYQLRADTHDAMRKWVVVLTAAKMAVHDDASSLGAGRY